MEQLTRVKAEQLSRQIEVDLRRIAGLAARRAVDAMLKQERVPIDPIPVELHDMVAASRKRMYALKLEHPEWVEVWRAYHAIEAATTETPRVTAGGTL